MGLVLDAVPEQDLDAAVDRLAARIEGIPRNQLMMQEHGPRQHSDGRHAVRRNNIIRAIQISSSERLSLLS
jgi:hypothetical protein